MPLASEWASMRESLDPEMSEKCVIVCLTACYAQGDSKSQQNLQASGEEWFAVVQPQGMGEEQATEKLTLVFLPHSHSENFARQGENQGRMGIGKAKGDTYSGRGPFQWQLPEDI